MRNSLNDDFLLREEKPIVLDDYSLPIPDISLVKQRPDDPYFVGSHPKASEVSMVIEISDSSYLRDRNVKLAAYAQASIAEYWIVNVKKIEWFRSSKSETSEYSEIGVFTSDELIERSVFSLDFLDLSF